MSLREAIQAYKEGFRKKAPKDAQEVMQRATRDLQASGMAERAVAVGDKAPDFTLPDTEGNDVSLSGLLEKGPVVLGFYRGRW